MQKKSSSVNKNNKIYKFANMTMMSNNGQKLKNISLSQGKCNNKANQSKISINKSNNNINNNNINSNQNNNKKNSTLNNFNIKKITITNNAYINHNSNGNTNSNINKQATGNNNNKNINKYSTNANNFKSPSPNMQSIFPHGYLDGYKTTYFNKSNDKYNYPINTGYFKEEDKKYHNNVHNVNIGDLHNVIDENEEYADYNQKKMSISKEKKKNKNKNKLFIKYSDNYKYNFGGIGFGKNFGNGTFYMYNRDNINFKEFGKKKNLLHLPQLNKFSNNINSMNKNKHNKYNSTSKKKFKYY